MIHLTFDQDWAPAWATTAVAAALERRGLRGTLFVTHDCPSLAELRRSGVLELAWHPNFLPGSSHGATPEVVLQTMADIVPEARGVRAHCLVRSTPLWTLYGQRGLHYEASDLLDGMPGLRPLVAWNGLVRLPIWFEDDVHLMHGRTLTLEALDLAQPGMKCCTFHPILVALNAGALVGYRHLKAVLSTQGRVLSDATVDEVTGLRDGRGLGDLFEALLDWLVDHREEVGGTLGEVAAAARKGA